MVPARSWAQDTKGRLYWALDRELMTRFIGLSNHIGYRQYWTLEGTGARSSIRELVGQYGGTPEDFMLEVNEGHLFVLEQECFGL